MNLKDYSRPDQLERYSFLWSEARLLIAAVALFLGGVPVLRALFSGAALSGVVGLLLTVSWLISGAASAYLVYRWYTGGQVLFGKKYMPDTVAFFVMIVSGFNLGLVVILGRNIGMSISSNYMMFVATAFIYIGTALYLFSRWNASGKRLFG